MLNNLPFGTAGKMPPPVGGNSTWAPVAPAAVPSHTDLYSLAALANTTTDTAVVACRSFTVITCTV